MKKIEIKRAYPYLVAAALFIVAAYAYFPALLEGKVVQQPDVSSWRAAANEIIQYRERSGEEPLWTNAMFGGMPSTMISTEYKGNLLEPVYRFLFVGPRPASYLILAFAGFFLLLLSSGAGVRVAAAGALAFGFCAYNFQIISAGHNSKMVAIALMPAVIAAMIHALRRDRWSGALLFGVALSFEILANHPQITYYLAIVALALGVAELWRAARGKTLPSFLKTATLLVVAAALAVGTNVNHLWPTWEYGKQTMRGGSELGGGEAGGGGLDRSYATSWSYGPGETFNLLIPNFKGGASTPFDPGSRTYKALATSRDPAAETYYRQARVYWGEQAFTAGPMYMGAIPVFLFLVGLVLARGATRWWIAGVSLLAVLLAWGNHFAFLTDLFHDHVPLYNKFRVPSMILVILQLTIPLLGFLALDAILKRSSARPEVARALKIGGGIAAGACLLFALLPGLAGNFLAAGEEGLPAYLRSALAGDREALLRADAFRSLAFILLAAGVIWLNVAGKLRATRAIVAIAALLVVDMWVVDKRYLNQDHFASRREIDARYQPLPVDKIILQDKSPDYRVLDLSTDPFNDSRASYFHKNVGGYSAAKLQRYQEMIEHFISPEIQRFGQEVNAARSLAGAEESLARQKVLNMLNTKYVILDPNAAPVENRAAMGNAWFVREYELVASARDELEGLRHADPAGTAIIHERFAPLLQDRGFNFDESATIRLLEYAPNRLEYATSAADDQLALFSEVYYPDGWHATVDGEPAAHFRANYILRGMIVPAGQHVIVFRFEPASYHAGARISTACSGALLLLLLGRAGFCGTRFARNARHAKKETRP
jgi:hypothetical protein